MATQWVRSCKSTSVSDVVDHKTPKNRPAAAATASCRKGVQGLKDVIETTKKTKKPKKKPKQPTSSVAPEPGSNREKNARILQTVAVTGLLSPALTELPAGHPSRNVVEIIFRSGWSPVPFSGRVEVVFKVRNPPGTAARFEEYREKVKARAGGGADNARCAADGNEVMGFHCLGPVDGNVGYDGAWKSSCGKAALCVFSGGGGAHESGGGGGRGRRAMLVCRVIVGRICKRVGLKCSSEGRVGFDSVSGENGELIVFDTRAVLPCFLILYIL